ncbi:MAG TPA: plastocyanin/azurin family copper-binding protein [Solirubrobacterales bacterium]|jgi:plastocyanin|nr:plastocyanin/azurin family copper-binding protein [Solirubrobacterales bacterium]
MKKFVALFALLLAALALVACGGGSDTTSEESAPAPETTKEAEGEKEAEGGTAGAATADFEADPSGNLAYTADEATSKAGKVTVNFTNQSAVPHDVAIEDEAGETVAQTEVLAEGSDSATANLEPGTYKYFCTVPGHRQAGMEGTLTVK